MIGIGHQESWRLYLILRLLEPRHTPTAGITNPSGDGSGRTRTHFPMSIAPRQAASKQAGYIFEKEAPLPTSTTTPRALGAR